VRFREQLLNAPAKLGFGHLAQVGHGVSFEQCEQALYGGSPAGS
jgi:hypothetical protein